MRLTDLDPHFLQRRMDVAGPDHGRLLPDGTTQWGGFPVVVHHRVDTLAEADGIQFLCPKCFKAHGGPIGTHIVICWQPGRVPDDAHPGPGRWTFSGTGYNDLTLSAPSSSILLQGGCAWHGFVQAGEVTDA